MSVITMPPQTPVTARRLTHRRTGIANPTGLIVSAALLLDWWGTRMNQPAYLNASKAIESAVDHYADRVGVRTRDLGGSASTTGLRDDGR